MTPLRPPCQLELALPMPGRSEAPRPEAQEVEAVTATAEPESLALTDHLMEAICAPDNLEAALRAVVRNKGAPGIDGITVKQLPGVLQARWPEIEGQLRQGRYQPQPVRRVTIPKPAGGTRNLGIPTAIDRVIQQAVLQQLQPLWDPTFSEHSYGFRPGRSAHQAVAQAQAYVIAGYQFVVDIDLAKFFDRVHHDRLVAAVAARVSDRRLLRLIRAYLTVGVLDNGLFEASREGVPQGGPVTPPTMVQNFLSIWRRRSQGIVCDPSTATASWARRCCCVGHPRCNGRITEAPMWRRKTNPPTLKVRVSHEVTRLEKQWPTHLSVCCRSSNAGSGHGPISAARRARPRSSRSIPRGENGHDTRVRRHLRPRLVRAAGDQQHHRQPDRGAGGPPHAGRSRPDARGSLYRRGLQRSHPGAARA